MAHTQVKEDIFEQKGSEWPVITSKVLKNDFKKSENHVRSQFLEYTIMKNRI